MASSMYVVLSNNVKKLANKITSLTKNFAAVKEEISNKQDKLESGVNIKTINNTPLIGAGNITITGGGTGVVDDTIASGGINPVTGSAIYNALSGKLDKLTDTQLNVLTNGAIISEETFVTVQANISALMDASVNKSDLIDYNTLDASIKEAIANNYDSSVKQLVDASLNSMVISVDASIKEAITNNFDTSVKQLVDASLSLKQDKLTDDQLSAINSGITQSKVQQYDNLISGASLPKVTVSYNEATKTLVMTSSN